MNIFKDRRIVIGLVFLLLLFIVAYIISTSVVRSDKVAALIKVVPKDATLTIDGHKINSGTIHLEPGMYSIEGSKEGFEKYSRTLYIGEAQQTIPISLQPVSKEAKQWAKEHESDYTYIFGLGEQRAAEIGKDFNKKNPIAAHLPYRTFTYTIGYTNDPNDPSGNSIILTVYARDGYRLAALYKIRELGYDPTDFNITFKDYENPFPL